MSKKNIPKKYTILVSDGFGHTQEGGTYEVSFRRWLVREIEEGRMSVREAMERFNFNPTNGAALIRAWQKKYAPDGA